MPPTKYTAMDSNPLVHHENRRAIRSHRADAMIEKRHRQETVSKAGAEKTRRAVAETRKAQIDGGKKHANPQTIKSRK